jgi:hypothetical protein
MSNASVSSSCALISTKATKRQREVCREGTRDR